MIFLILAVTPPPVSGLHGPHTDTGRYQRRADDPRSAPRPPGAQSQIRENVFGKFDLLAEAASACAQITSIWAPVSRGVGVTPGPGG